MPFRWHSCFGLPWRWSVLIVLVVAGIAPSLLEGCGAPPPVAGLLDAANSKPFVRAPRRAPYEPPKPQPVVEMKEEVPRTDWAAVLEELPKDATGGVDWAKALTEGLISPKAGIDPKAEEEPVLDLDLELVPKDMPEFKATYPHKIHTRMLACANCHTGIFQMEHGADAITMEKIFAGEYCGRCHGKVAFDPITACPRCHLEMPR